jgi:hypothetical protein
MAVAPVFLLTGVGAILSVLTTRLARVIDRGRQIDAWILEGQDPQHHIFELSKLARRNILINLSISLATLSAFFVCSVILVIFASQTFTDLSIFGDVGDIVAGLFVLAMLSLIASLILFLTEIWVSSTIHYFGHHLPPEK